MTQFAMITGSVTHTPGDGVPMEIPQGRVEIDLSFDSATLSWEAAKGIAGLAAIPRTAFEEYVEGGKITLEDKLENDHASQCERTVTTERARAIQAD